MNAVLNRAEPPQHRARRGGWRRAVGAELTPLRVETAFWLILLGGLAAGVGLETNWGRQTQWPVETMVETRPEFSKPALAEPFRPPSADQYLQITARPLFVVTRRPAPIALASEAPKAGMIKDQFILMGTTIAGKNRIAFLVEKAGNKSRVVAQGKEINGVTVREVMADRIVLSQFGDTETLVLKTNKPPAGAHARTVGAQGVPFPAAPTPPAVQNPFLGNPAPPPAVQKPFFGVPAAPAGAQGAPPPVGFPGQPAGKPAAVPPGDRGANPFLPGSAYFRQ